MTTGDFTIIILLATFATCSTHVSTSQAKFKSILVISQLEGADSCLLVDKKRVYLFDCLDASRIYNNFTLNTDDEELDFYSDIQIKDSITCVVLCFRPSGNCTFVFLREQRTFELIKNVKLFPKLDHSVSLTIGERKITGQNSLNLDLFYLYSFKTSNDLWNSEFRRLPLINENNRVVDAAQLTEQHFQSPRNIFTFIFDGFVYFLRNKQRKNLYSNFLESVIVLDRICLNDLNNNELRSFISSPLFVAGNGKASSMNDGYFTAVAIFADFDEINGALNVLIEIIDEQITDKSIYKLFTFTMSKVAAEIDQKFMDCYNRSDVFDVAILSPSPSLCRDYKMFEAINKPCGVDLCSPSSCVVYARYHVESYQKIHYEKIMLNATLSTTEIEKYGRIEKFIILGEKIVSLTTTAGFVLIMFVDGQSSSIFYDFPFDVNLSQYFMVLVKDTLVIANGNQLDYIQLNCSLLKTCDDCLKIRRLAPKFSNCGWCFNPTGKSFSSTSELCDLNADNSFLIDHCPPEIKCVSVERSGFENNFVDPFNSTLINLTGYFAALDNSQINITICGSSCDIKSSDDNILTCEVRPPFELKPKSNDCAIHLKIMFANATYETKPSCSEKLYLYNDVSVDQVVQQNSNLSRDSGAVVAILLCVAAIVSFLLAVVCYVYRNFSFKRKCDNDSGSHWYDMLPIRQFTFLSHAMNTYVTEPGTGSYYSVERLDGFCDDMSYLVPDQIKIPWGAITKQELIGMGHFGEVYKGLFKKTPSSVGLVVAMKTLRMGARNVKQFVEEGVRMEYFDHDNVLSLVGITFNEFNYPLIVTPFMAYGDLLSYLRNVENSPTVRDLLDFAVQIADGLKYLHQLRYIHRDLAARNCMLDENLRIKVADFGLSRDVYESEFYLSVNLNMDVPVRWLPPESIERQEYSPKSDIWSYGVAFWELMTRGLVPYSHLSGYRLLDYIKNGQRLPKPKMCPNEIFELMKMCWHVKPENRPDCEEVCVRLRIVIKLLESDAPGYYNMGASLEMMSQYEIPSTLAVDDDAVFSGLS